MSSRWANSAEDDAAEAKQKREKEQKRALKLAKQQAAVAIEEAAKARAQVSQLEQGSQVVANGDDAASRPAKRRRLSPHGKDEVAHSASHTGATADAGRPLRKLLRGPSLRWSASRSVEDFEKLNDIEEGAYGWVSRAKDSQTGEVVALKRLKLDGSNSQDGVPVTGLREIQTLRACSHENIVALREVVVGEDRSKVDSIFIVLEFLEHDLKSLLSDMPEPFLPSESKTLLLQLLEGVNYLHDQHILHRDLKTSNLLLSNRGVLKIADFGMARFYSPKPPATAGTAAAPAKLTQLVVTLWYRAPELLLGTDTYATEIDLWSVGCIFAELLDGQPLLPGTNEVDTLRRIFTLCGVPDETSWPGVRRLPNARALGLPHRAGGIMDMGKTTGGADSNTTASSSLRARYPFLTTSGCALLTSLLSLNPARRPSAATCLAHPFFQEAPAPKSRRLFPTFPSRAGQERRRRRPGGETPDAPLRGGHVPSLEGLGGLFGEGIFGQGGGEGGVGVEKGAGFSLKMV